MYVTSCAKNILTICIVTVLMFILSMAGSAAAIPITITVPGNLPFPIATFPASVPSSEHLIATEDDMCIPLVDAASSDFMAWTFAVTAPPKPRLSPVLSLAEGNRVSHRVFPNGQDTPGVLRTTGVLFGQTPVVERSESPGVSQWTNTLSVLRTTGVLLDPHADALAEVKLPVFSCFEDISGSFLGEHVRFPLPDYGDAPFPSAQLLVPPDISIPEPGTLVLFTAALGSIFGYGLWRYRKHGSAQLTSSPERFLETFQG
jgi:hypothetical protein